MEDAADNLLNNEDVKKVYLGIKPVGIGGQLFHVGQRVAGRFAGAESRAGNVYGIGTVVYSRYPAI